ncbi:hypothetical protein Y032_0004g2253 [Ancylostoma ceylanicum]|uniref:Uncharacterized protein n=1 Tax=Ancylostoma ceylanicum TaxID=53326 RepID=A0A016VVK8_9BILA|nr:hypothetical protein Y032_0004g2253 [Ancylostoma ceylanicum]
MVILVLEPTVMIGYSAVNKNRKEVNHICIKEKLMHQKQAQPSKSKESFGFLKTATWRRDEGRFMSPLSILCVLLLVYTASTEVVNEIRGTNEDENTVDITEEKRGKRYRYLSNPWLLSKKISRILYRHSQTGQLQGNVLEKFEHVGHNNHTTNKERILESSLADFGNGFEISVESCIRQYT